MNMKLSRKKKKRLQKPHGPLEIHAVAFWIVARCHVAVIPRNVKIAVSEKRKRKQLQNGHPDRHADVLWIVVT